MMKAVLKSIDTGGQIAFESYWPEDLECFGLWLTVLTGPDDSEGGHLYQILVCTPEWIKKECLDRGAVWGRHMLIVPSFDPDQIKSEIVQYVEGCTGKDFGEIAQKVARIGAWEFEDYQS
jgi:hypothetical protein